MTLAIIIMIFSNKLTSEWALMVQHQNVYSNFDNEYRSSKAQAII